MFRDLHDLYFHTQISHLRLWARLRPWNRRTGRRTAAAAEKRKKTIWKGGRFSLDRVTWSNDLNIFEITKTYQDIPRHTKTFMFSTKTIKNLDCPLPSTTCHYLPLPRQVSPRNFMILSFPMLTTSVRGQYNTKTKFDKIAARKDSSSCSKSSSNGRANGSIGLTCSEKK